VERAEFDMMIMEKAKSSGAEVLEETKVSDVIRDERGAVVGVKAVSKDGSSRDFLAPMTIDASGRDGLVLSKQKWRKRDPKLKRVALWTYYKGAMRDEGLDAGSTTVAYIPEKGWFWYIPLKNDVVSVGVVAERDYLYAESSDPAAIMTREIGNNQWIKEHLAPGEQFGEYWATGEYSYRSKYCAGDGVVLAGDAFAFLDPVFSSGVYLALKTGEMAADAVDAALEKEDYGAEHFESYGAKVCEMIEVMRKLVYAFYDRGFSFGKVIRKHPEVRSDLTDCLIGNVDDRDFDDLFAAVAEFAEMPPELEYGKGAAPSQVAEAS
jgi:flavin-dependent dehydrogenase